VVNNFLERYTATGETFSGGMGEVEIYEDQHLERKVVIKFIKNDNDRNRLTDEVKALQEICSKHVVQIFDVIFCESTRRLGIVQEFVPGKDLEAIADAGVFDQEEYLKILYQISSGLADIHKQGLVHRDVKPSNIKLDEENIFKIFDFGLARSSVPEASTLGFVGTPIFAAPELHQSGIVSFTEDIDTYAFGVTAWLLSGAILPTALSAIPPKGYDTSFDFKFLAYNLGNEISRTLNLSLSQGPADRPKMKDIAKLIQKYLLRGRHRAIIVSKGKIYNLTEGNRSVTLQANHLGTIGIQYDGLDFRVSSVGGNAYINNQKIIQDYVLPASCVITLGDTDQERLFITFDISNPEVVL
jgi:eukaryotic-like serine/threonine-protein kinase